MSRRYPDVLFTESVRAAQRDDGSPNLAERMLSMPYEDDRLGPREVDFIEQRDGFYLATVNQDGWPYVQFRGGPRGFVRILDDRLLGYADFRGNRQLISMGNLRTDDRTSLFFMDYANRARLKVLARTRMVSADADPALLDRLVVPGYDARPERAVLMEVVAFDWNCPQHITPRYSAEELSELGVTLPRR